MQQNIGVAVANRVAIVGDLDPAEPQGAAFGKAMRVVTNPNPVYGRGPSSQS
jgi:hypothetical protein